MKTEDTEALEDRELNQARSKPDTVDHHHHHHHQFIATNQNIHNNHRVYMI